MVLKKVCKICGKEFESKGKFALCDSCKIQHCIICGREFTPVYPYNGKCCSNKCRAELRKRTNLEKYGVDNPSKRPEVLQKIKATFEEKYGGHPMTTREVQDKVEATNLRRYGVKRAAQNEQIKQKGIDTLIRNHGGIGYSSSELRKKIESTNLEKYGAATPFESQVVQGIIKEVNIDRYGHENPMKNPEVVERLQHTFQDKYGTPWAIGAPEVRKKIEQTFMDKYGTTSILSVPEVKEKVAKTNLDKFGTPHPAQNPQVLEKMTKTSLERYGTPYFTTTSLYKQQVILDPSKCAEYEEFLQDPVKYIESHFMETPTAGTLAKTLGISDSHLYQLASDMDFYDRLEHHYSTMENEVYEFLVSIGITNILRNDRQQIKPLEIDLYLPDYKFGIECNPTDTHNSSFIGPFEEPPKPYNYHQVKSKAAIENGITLFHLFGYEWKYKRSIIESMLKNSLGLSSNKVYARDTYVCEVEFKDCVKFLVDNHRQGSTSAPVRLGLKSTSTNELLSVMTFNKVRANQGSTKDTQNNDWELSRFCSKLDTNVIGGASKLFKHFLNMHHPNKVVSFSDVAHTRGGLYEKLGFQKVSWSSPDYVWVRIKDNKTFNRSNTMKSNLSKFLGEEVDLSKTEKQIMEEHGYAQVFDSGVIRWEYTCS